MMHDDGWMDGWMDDDGGGGGGGNIVIITHIGEEEGGGGRWGNKNKKRMSGYIEDGEEHHDLGVKDKSFSLLPPSLLPLHLPPPPPLLLLLLLLLTGIVDQQQKQLSPFLIPNHKTLHLVGAEQNGGEWPGSWW